MNRITSLVAATITTGLAGGIVAAVVSAQGILNPGGSPTAKADSQAEVTAAAATTAAARTDWKAAAPVRAEAWARTTVRAFRGVEVGKVRLSVELCAVYWHFLFLVWAVLFAVLLHSHR